VCRTLKPLRVFFVCFFCFVFLNSNFNSSDWPLRSRNHSTSVSGLLPGEG